MGDAMLLLMGGEEVVMELMGGWVRVDLDINIFCVNLNQSVKK